MSDWLQNKMEEFLGKKFLIIPRSEVLKDPAKQALEREKCRRYFPYWLFRWVYTTDPHSVTNTTRPFPKMDFHFYLATKLLTERRILIPKSRKMQVTWHICAYLVWKFQYNPNFFISVQSLRESEASDIVDRCYSIYQKEPSFVLPPHFKAYRKGGEKHPKLLGSNGAKILGFPEGGEQVRPYTINVAFVDEAAKLVDLSATIAALNPTLGKHGQMILASSVRPSVFSKLCRDL